MNHCHWIHIHKIVLLLISLSAFGFKAIAQETIPVQSLYLEMDARDADVLFKKDRFDRSTFPVSMFDNGKQLFGRIAVKGSFSRNFDKKSLKIKFNKGSEWQGQRRIGLNAMSTDPSMMREWLAWNLIHTLGMAAPKVNYTRLFINQRYIGMYLYIEWIDTKMLSKFNLGSDGDFYHPIDAGHCGDLSPQSVSNPEHCWFRLSPRDNDFSSLKKLVRQLKEIPAENFDTFLQQYFDVDSVINWIATNVITSNGDTYNKNYFLYYSRKTQRWVIIPWDYDLSFGRNWDEYLPFPHNVLNDNFQYYYPLELGLPNPLKNKLLNNPILLKRLKLRIRGLLGLSVENNSETSAWFTPKIMHNRIDALYEMLVTDLHRERYTTISQTELHDFSQGLKAYVTFRYNYLRKTVLETPDWVADQAVVSVEKPGDRYSWVDGFGKTLGTIQAIDLKGKANVMLVVESMQPPLYTPNGISADSCLKRSWLLISKTPYTNLKINLSLQYLQENSKLNEIGKKVDHENKLRLWVHRSDQWIALNNTINTVSNVIQTKEINIKAGVLYRFIACQN